MVRQFDSAVTAGSPMFWSSCTAPVVVRIHERGRDALTNVGRLVGAAADVRLAGGALGDRLLEAGPNVRDGQQAEAMAATSTAMAA